MVIGEGRGKEVRVGFGPTEKFWRDAPLWSRTAQSFNLAMVTR